MEAVHCAPSAGKRLRREPVGAVRPIQAVVESTQVVLDVEKLSSRDFEAYQLFRKLLPKSDNCDLAASVEKTLKVRRVATVVSHNDYMICARAHLRREPVDSPADEVIDWVAVAARWKTLRGIRPIAELP
jgi:hypothetical protein